MIVLQEKGLWESCGNKLCEFSKKEHKSEEVLKLNPRGQVSIQNILTATRESGSLGNTGYESVDWLQSPVTFFL